ncbi:SDR family oxidoreductase [Streptomyces sp. SID13031]|uniref:SDR family oxidoreductase n=1 Tax=Streptomyces sp. SID13031 TaxID=2706046 RepID=UPI0013C5467B|nr:SDR family oxidoreductase [Streptomyces sp. SID13031]NEA30519.1 NAD-dependent epimerase/dehydratase family protein [Streptomyces sp. SID13031]
MSTPVRLQIVDGSTGFVGANLIHRLLANGNQVVALARQPVDAVRNQISGAAIADGDLDLTGLRVLNWSLDEPDLGLTQAEVEELFADPCDYWHLAAAITFRPGNHEELQRVNVDGTRTALEVFHKYAPTGSRFFQVSSAYSCGLVTDEVPEVWHQAAEPQEFRNYYEYTKREAELLYADTPGAVLRLGQIVGDSRTGRAATDYGLYDYIRAIHTITRRRPNELLRVIGDPAAELHLVPVDACVRWMTEIATRDLGHLDPPVIHLVDSVSVTAAKVAELISAHLPVDLRIAPQDEVATAPLNQLERVLEARMTYTGKYISRSLKFRRDNLPALGIDEPPTVPDDVLDRLVGSYARSLLTPNGAAR